MQQTIRGHLGTWWFWGGLVKKGKKTGQNILHRICTTSIHKIKLEERCIFIVKKGSSWKSGFVFSTFSWSVKKIRETRSEKPVPEKFNSLQVNTEKKWRDLMKTKMKSSLLFKGFIFAVLTFHDFLIVYKIWYLLTFSFDYPRILCFLNAKMT